jgi:sRNA-binding protein
MARFAKLNAYIDQMEGRLDQMTSEEIEAMMNTPRAKARAEVLRAKDAARDRKKVALWNKKKEAETIHAATFTVGQSVSVRLKGNGTVLAVNENVITVETQYGVAKYVASAVTAI